MTENSTTAKAQRRRIDAKAFLSIIRPQNCIIGGLTVVAGIAMAYRMNPVGTSILSYLFLFIFGYATYFFVAAGGNVVNDIYDIEVDKINRPRRALPSGRMTVNQAWAYVGVLSALGVFFAWLNGSIGTLIVMFFESAGYAYAAKVKALGLAGNLMVAFSFAFGVIYGSFIYAERIKMYTYMPIPTLLFFLTAFMILQARETIKGAEDVEGDAMRNVRTIARVYGYHAAAGVQAVLNLVGVLCYYLVWYWGYASYDLVYLLYFGAAVVIAAAIAPITGPNNKKRLVIGSTLDKVGALIGLIAFVTIPFYAIFWP
jgi:geranylgeranylglycerol-phosphate geranylgeranyltransferase